MSGLLNKLEGIVGQRHVLTSESATYPFRKGFRFGLGRVEAVVMPHSLVELWHVAQSCVQEDRILIMQASNTGLTGGSSPDGNAYDRPIILVSTRHLKGIHLVGGGKQVVCLPGATLYELEEILSPIGREPHSLIGSSCIGASVLGGVSNNSGGSLVQRGPAFTEMALFGQVDEKGALHLVNHLGLRLKGDPEQVLAAVEKGTFSPDDVEWSAGRGHDADYIDRVRDVDADTPARFNADPGRLYEASGCAGKLVVFAVRLDTFPAEKDTAVFYLGTNSTGKLEDLRRAVLSQFDEMPIAGEYLHRDTFEIADHYGRDTVVAIRYLGTKHLPFFFAMKEKIDLLSQKVSFFPDALGDRVLQAMSRLFPSQVPKRIMAYHKRFEHHLMLKVSGQFADTLRPWLQEFCKDGDMASFECTADEGKLAFLHRFAAAGAAGRYAAVNRKTTGGMMALDVGLRRNDREWFEKLPPEVDNKLVVKLYYGHFFCHVMHQDYVVKQGYNPVAVEHEMWPLLDKRGARYPAEHNVGHLYNAPQSMLDHYRSLDPCNCMNPGIGRSTKRKNWVAESV